MTVPPEAFRKGESRMKNRKILSLAFLAAGTLVLALLLQMAGRGVLPRGSRSGGLRRTGGLLLSKWDGEGVSSPCCRRQKAH